MIPTPERTPASPRTEDDASTTVVLLNMGGPDSPEAVRGFLLNLFHDPDILRLPGGRLTRPLLARFIVWRRLERVKASYGRIGGGSPIARIMADQARLLEERLGPRVRVRCAMRYWHPFTDETLREIPAHHRVVFLSLYPHWCSATTGSSLNEARRVMNELALRFRATAQVESYPDDSLFLQAWEARIGEAFAQGSFDPRQTHVVFSAHGLPLSVVRRGDPYEKQVRATVERLAGLLPAGVGHTLAFQSRVGPVKWLEPDVRKVVDDLGAQGTKTLVVVPVSFTVDNLETLFELDIELREQAHGVGISDFRCVRAPNTHPLFIEALASLASPHIEAQQ